MAGLGLHLVIVGWRYLFSGLALPLRLKRKVIIVGAGHSGRRILDAIRRRPHAGLEPEGHLIDRWVLGKSRWLPIFDPTGE